MADETQKRVYDEVISVLNEFGITYQEIQKSNHGAIEFWAGGKRCVFPLGGGGYRAPLNARSSVRNILIAAGAKPVPITSKRSELLSSTTIPDFELPHLEPAKASPPIAKLPPPEPKTIPPWVKKEEPVTIEQPAVKEKPVEPEPVVVQRIAQLNPDEAYLLYQPRHLVPGNVIVIELDHDLMLEKGNVVVVPLHKPSGIMGFTRQQFDAMFAGVEAAEEPPVQPEPVMEPVMIVPDEPEEIEEPLVVTEEQPIVHRVAEGVSGKRKTPPPREAKPYNPYRTGPSSIEGISPQPGRILGAMAYITDTTHKSDLVPAMFNDVLDAVDRKQYAARIIAMIRMGYVDRGLPVPGARGYHHKITALGRRTVKKLGSWPWLYDGIEPPDWLASVTK